MAPNGRQFARRLTRRRLLRAGSLGVAGLSLASLLRAEANRGGLRPPARNCILFFLEGGPAHQDLWDLKPQAPAEIRGEFQPIATTVPGVEVCEHLPLLARQMHHTALVRSVHHGVVDHNAGAYYALTGRSPLNGSRLIVKDEAENFPPFGSLLARLRPVTQALPPFVHVPEIMSNNNYDLPGQRAGFLGPAFDPLVSGDPSVSGYQVPGLARPAGMAAARIADRRELLAELEQCGQHQPAETAWQDLDSRYRQAFELVLSTAARQAFDLEQEPSRVRERYGLPDRADRSVEARKFGGLPHLGQSLLLARRLIEAGVRLVTVGTGRRYDQAWDTHRQHFPLLKQSLLPYFDRGFSALLEDLHVRGLLDETLVVAMGEFGRTPRLGQITSGAGADAAGRDHWPHCYTVLLAGAGIQAGVVHGASDRFAAYPARDPVTPEDIAATIYQALGIDPAEHITDPFGRPLAISLGQPILAVLRSAGVRSRGRGMRLE